MRYRSAHTWPHVPLSQALACEFEPLHCQAAPSLCSSLAEQVSQHRPYNIHTRNNRAWRIIQACPNKSIMLAIIRGNERPGTQLDKVSVYLPFPVPKSAKRIEAIARNLYVGFFKKLPRRCLTGFLGPVDSASRKVPMSRHPFVCPRPAQKKNFPFGINNDNNTRRRH